MTFNIGVMSYSRFHPTQHVLSAARHPREHLHSNTVVKHPVLNVGPVAGATFPSFVFLHVLGLPFKLLEVIFQGFVYSRRRKVIM